MEEQKVFISPKIDFSFKEIMKREKAVKSFLSAVLKIAREEMKEIQAIDPHLDKRYEKDKLSILDVRLVLNNQTEINIEMQISPFPHWGNRSLYYNCRQFTDQAKEGDKYADFKRCVHISILDFNLLSQKESPGFYSSFHLREDKSGLLYTDMLAFYVLELKKLPPNELTREEPWVGQGRNTEKKEGLEMAREKEGLEKRITKGEEQEDPLVLWGRFINAQNQEELENLRGKDPGIDDALEGLKAIQMDAEKRHAYLRRQMALMDYETQMESAREEGLEEGKKEGLEEGLEKGKQEVALNALKLKMDVEDIMKITGLSLEIIRDLDKNRQ